MSLLTDTLALPHFLDRVCCWLFNSNFISTIYSCGPQLKPWRVNSWTTVWENESKWISRLANHAIQTCLRDEISGIWTIVLNFVRQTIEHISRLWQQLAGWRNSMIITWQMEMQFVYLRPYALIRSSMTTNKNHTQTLKCKLIHSFWFIYLATDMSCNGHQVNRTTTDSPQLQVYCLPKHSDRRMSQKELMTLIK